MTNLNSAMATFWRSFNLPVYLSGNVPDGAAFPYITFECVQGAPFGSTYITANAWFKTVNGASINAQRATLADSIRTAIPPQGVTLTGDNGFVIIYPNNTNFLSYNDNAGDDSGVKGLRISCEIHFCM